MSKKIKFLLVMSLLAAVSLAQAFQPVHKEYTDSWDKHGFNLNSSSRSNLVVNHSITNFSIENRQINNETLQSIVIPGNLLPNDAGKPNLPGFSRYLAIPEGASATYRITNFRTEVFSDVNLMPAPVIPKDSEDGPLVYERDQDVYSRNEYYPESPVIISDPSQIRGVDVVMLGITPFQYNPQTRELLVYRDIEIEVEFRGGNGRFGEDRLRNRWWEPVIQDAILNSNILPELSYSNQSNNRTPDYEYIIITPDDPDFLSWADSIKTFRTLQGIRTGVVTTTEIGGNNATTIENYLNDAYNTWDVPPVACLILGDYGTSGSTVVSPIWDGYCVSDNIYGDVDEDDMPDIVMARITARNASELETMIEKFLENERDPSTNANFYDNPITALGWQTSRWFQICSESIGGFWSNELGKSQVRINAIYSGNPNSDPWSTATNTATVLSEFGPNGLGYIPASPSALGGWTGGNATMVNNAINSGAFMMQHRDHGGVTGWGEPDYDISDMSGLTNDDLVFVFSINCLTGKFDDGQECFAEAFHRHQYGALGLIAASEVSYSFVNDTFVWGMYDNMWPDFMPDYGSTPDSRGILPAFGNAAGKYFLQASSWPYNTSNKEVTYNLFHMHGDAFTSVYSEMPQQLTVNHDPSMISGTSTFSVTADDGAFIALTVNGDIIGTAEATGVPVDIQIDPQLPGNDMIVTVTKQNYYRYEQSVSIIPPSGPYVIKDSYSIDDSGANNNGMLDYGESVLLDLTMKNLGTDMATNVDVTISTTDTYVTITDNTENFGNIPANSTVTVTGGFAFDVAEDVPDLHEIPFVVTATDGVDTWTSNLVMEAHAPIITITDATIDDSATGNNNGRLDPGETVDITITTENIGTSDSPDANATTTSNSPELTINSCSGALGIIPANSSSDGTVNVTVDANIQIGESVSLDYVVVAGIFQEMETFDFCVGLNLEDFEDDDGGYISGGTNDCWEWGEPSYASGPATANSGSKCWGTSLTGNFPNSSQCFLQTIEFDLPTADPYFKFYHWYDFGPSNWDGGNLKISTDGGSSWELIYPDGGYTDDLASSNPLSPEPGYCGEPGLGWVEANFDLSAYSGESVIIKFDFGSTSVVDHPGWYIDDVEVNAATGNPTTGTIAGTITLDGGTGNVEDVEVEADGVIANPDANGDYSLELDPGTYDVTATLADYIPATVEDVVVNAGSMTGNIDMTLVYSTAFNPPTNVTVNEATGTISWDPPAVRDLEGYNVYLDDMNNPVATNITDLQYTYSGLVPGQTYIAGVSAVYENPAGESVIVEIEFTYPLPTFNAPSNLQAAVMDYNDVELTWEQPSGQGGEFLHHGGYDNNGIGTGGAADWICAARFDNVELGDFYDNCAITEVKVHVRSTDFTYVGIKVYEGGSFGDPGTEVYDADITANVVIDDWTIHTLTTPVPLVSGNEYWIGYEINATGDHPSSVDMGPMVPDKGSWMYFNGTWDLLTNLGATLDFNWCITGVAAPLSDLSAGKSIRPERKANEHPELPLMRTSAKLEAAFDRPVREVRTDNVRETRALSGYKVYRDGSMIHEITDPNMLTYTDAALDAGTYEYHVTAIYSDPNGESDPSNTDEAEVTLPAPTNASASSAGSNVSIQWDNPARSLESFNIYRDDLTDPVATGVTSNFYVHTNVPSGDYIYNVTAVYSGGYESDYSNDAEIEHVDASAVLVPTVTELVGNHPNPFNPETNIEFSLKEAGKVTLEIYNLKGQKVRTLADGEFSAAYHTVMWDGKDAKNNDVTSGVYFYRLQTENYDATRKMILLK